MGSLPTVKNDRLNAYGLNEVTQVLPLYQGPPAGSHAKVTG